ncbi:hypothetical protein SLUN_38940 (plasmid) [Streptomyces lunaelactis]|uniref:Helix-turn-helix domain-containing protein n=1 Tax=Streptomyces lunaelactis TaxID=1535768 RepID=A0A2R4TFU8_9ACTN|nr:helix-turn-helix domain-containing protein [Streptomyces lunaelactis]AVZ78008.1 hypothetical protein SLUN_38940 [Streptomyces lunaelactis]NUK84968.1 helix-turn-helix domain-containing protein [Streptomyces lunaelactis]
MSDFPDENDLWADGLPEDVEEPVDEADGELDELDGPPVEFRRGRRSRYKFTMTPQWVLLMTELSHPAFRLYCLMLAHVSSERDDQLVWPQQKTLAKMLGYSRRASVDPLIKLLVKLQLIEVEEKRYGHNNSRRRNVYTVHEEPPANWKGWASLQEFYAAEKAARKAARTAEKKAAEAAPKAAKGRTSVSAGQDGVTPTSPPAAAPASAPEHEKTGDATPSARPHGERGASATSGGTRTSKKASPKKASKTRFRMTREQAAAVATVEAAWPAALAELLPKYRPDVIRDAVLEALDGGRTADQLAARVQRRWSTHGYADALATGGKGIGSPVGVAVGLVRPSTDCPDPMCEDGVTIHVGDACPKCEQRRLDRKADRRQGRVPDQRKDQGPAPECWTCEGPDCEKPGKGQRPEDGLCRTCREQLQAATARLTADLAAADAERQRRADALAWEALLEDAYDEHQEREDQAAEARATAERERQRAADAAENQRLREEMLRQHPELAEYAQA